MRADHTGRPGHEETDMTDATAIAQETYARLEKAWNAADGPGFAAPFAQDATFVDIRGSLHRGRAAIAAGHQGIFDTIYAGSTVAFEVDEVRRPATGCVVAHALSRLEAPRAFLEPVTARSTVVLVDSAEGWQVVAFHNTLVAS
jgi:uncharacterized protein (TIGR02246 family)